MDGADWRYFISQGDRRVLVLYPPLQSCRCFRPGQDKAKGKRGGWDLSGAFTAISLEKKKVILVPKASDCAVQIAVGNRSTH